MKQVIRITEVEKPKKKLKPIEFTHHYEGGNGWCETFSKPNDYIKIVYLGKCKTDGDMFAAYQDSGDILITKGNLNDGVY